jgi:hypothetical protein
LNATPEQRRELTSWKEIADYLGVNVRTAQKWEKERGLPVRRMPGGSGRVSVDPAALAAWKDATLEKSGWWASLPFLRKYALLTTLLLLAVLGGAVGAYLALNHQGPPALYRVEQNLLIVSDQQGRELWRKAFHKPLHVKNYESTLARHAWFDDLDGDGHVETLFVPRFEHTAQTLICYSDRGIEKWRFLAGRAVSTRGETFDSVYGVIVFSVVPIGKRREKAVVVSCPHSLYYPNQVALLSAGGRLLREYWHSGGLTHLEIADLDGDGVSEIYLAGISNSTGSATLVVLDPDAMEGASAEEDRDYQLQGFAPGRERARILFPRSCMSRKFEKWSQVGWLFMQPDTIAVEAIERTVSRAPGIIFHLTKALKLEKVVLEDSFRIAHTEMHAAGQLDHKLTPQEEAEFRNIRVLVPPPSR